MTIAILSLFFFVGNDAPKPAEQLKQLVTESEAIEKSYRQEISDDRTAEGVRKAKDKHEGARMAWHKSALEAVRKNPDLAEAFEVIATMMNRSGSVPDVPELIALIRKHHAARSDLGNCFPRLVQSKEGKEFVEEMAEKSPAETIRAQAAYSIGRAARLRIMYDDLGIKKNETLGIENKLTEEERKQLEERAQKYFSLAAKYDDAPLGSWGDGKVGPTARAELLGLKNASLLKVGQVAPDIAGEDLDGTKFKLSDQRGKITVLVFWASWCAPCMGMVPYEKKLVERMKGKPFALIGMNGDGDKEKAKEAAKKHEMTWPSFWDAAERPDGQISKAWNIAAWPTIYVLDADGVIQFVGHGASPKLDKLVDVLVGKLGNK
jgi:thiol-disulfide isomerase/thioredoxin